MPPRSWRIQGTATGALVSSRSALAAASDPTPHVSASASEAFDDGRSHHRPATRLQGRRSGRVNCADSLSLAESFGFLVLPAADVAEAALQRRRVDADLFGKALAKSTVLGQAAEQIDDRTASITEVR